ncbi:MAG TPA: hypothetical protein PLP29_00790 [Candidatus Ozemobacteraceae bacterium]|nr:hypothetical protein [Candidatus Ozemobacteraceae bacterium]
MKYIMRFISCLFDSLLFCCLFLGLLFLALHALTILSAGSLFFTGSPSYGLHVAFFLLSVVAINLLFAVYVVQRLLSVRKTTGEPWRASEVIRVFGFNLTITPTLFYCLAHGHKPALVTPKPALVTAGIPETLIPDLVEAVGRNGAALTVVFGLGTVFLILHAFLKRDFDNTAADAAPQKASGD